MMTQDNFLVSVRSGPTEAQVKQMYEMLAIRIEQMREEATKANLGCVVVRLELFGMERVP